MSWSELSWERKRETALLCQSQHWAFEPPPLWWCLIGYSCVVVCVVQRVKVFRCLTVGEGVVCVWTGGPVCLTAALTASNWFPFRWLPFLGGRAESNFRSPSIQIPGHLRYKSWCSVTAPPSPRWWIICVSISSLSSVSGSLENQPLRKTRLWYLEEFMLSKMLWILELKRWSN